MTKAPFERLPSSIIPNKYYLTIQPDLVECTFKGAVVIDVEVKESVSTIVLNCGDLTLGETTFEQNGALFTPDSTDLNGSTRVLTITFAKSLEKATGKLKISFQGDLGDKLKGFYRMKYTLEGKDKYGACTQFEAADARHCFPCWDEPALKAFFDITLIVPSHLVALSNMPEVSRTTFEKDPSLSVVKYDTSPLMSTYLLAIVIGEFDFAEGFADGVKVRVYTPVGKKEQGYFGLEVATKTLSFYNDYFKINYPLPKLDLVGIPDFLVGAMENWGLITFRERAILNDRLNTSAAVRQNISLIIAHEIAHQWFGDLVTMEWWTHLWLNEGYATFTQYLAIDHIFPEFQVWQQFNVDSLIPALELDCLRSSHPIEVPVGSPDEVEEVFDQISYLKGASVIRMLHNYLGKEAFKRGMNLYLTKHQYKNTLTEDLWMALEESSGKPVRSMMSGWTTQTGYPLVTVSIKKENAKCFTFKQERFLIDRSEGAKGQWSVPISISFSSSPNTPFKEFLLGSTSTEIVLDIPNGDCIKINCGANGFYRLKYPEEMLSQQLPAIASKTFPPLDRLNIIDDLFALAHAGYSSTLDILKALPAYKEEDSFHVWSGICGCLAKLRILLSHTDYYELFSSFARGILQSIAQRVGWEAKPNESNLDKMLRSRILGACGVLGDETVIAESKKRLDAHIAGTGIIPADNRSFIYRTVASVADEATFEKMLKMYDDAELQEEKVRVAVSLGLTKNPVLIQKVLDFAMSAKVRNQDATHVLMMLAYTQPGLQTLWQFIKSNISVLKNRYEGTAMMSDLKIFLENFASNEIADEIESFFKANPILSAERAIQQAVEAIRLNAAWLNRDSAHIRQYLSSLK